MGKTGTQSKTIAVVIAGAVAKGAFEAGVIQALARADVKIARIVAASSGALNGTVLASAVRTNDLVGGADRLARLWEDHAEWNEVFHLSFRDLWKRDGISDQKRLLRLLSDHIAPSQLAQPAPVNLRLVVAALAGCPGRIGARSATKYESIRDFYSDDFGTPERLRDVFTAAMASAAFPLAFAPVDVEGVGLCIDGGCVNNTPMKWALKTSIDEDSDAIDPIDAIDAIVVIATSVEQQTTPPGDLSGLSTMVGHIANMLIDERLYRDLRGAENLNTRLAALDQLVTDGKLTPSALEDVKRALGWTHRRQVEIISIRPEKPLQGNAFSAFSDREMRRDYLAIGQNRGLEVLGAWQRAWRRPEEPASRQQPALHPESPEPT
jgi:NTE family protein